MGIMEMGFVGGQGRSADKEYETFEQLDLRDGGKSEDVCQVDG